MRAQAVNDSYFLSPASVVYCKRLLLKEDSVVSFTPVTLLLGIVLILGALALFFLDKIRPGYARESDKVYGVLMLVAGLLSLGHLTAGVTESFQLMLMTGMLMTLAVENVRKREAIIEPPMGRPDAYPPRPRYNERPPARRVYRAELDDRNAPRDSFGDRPGQRRPQRMAPGQDDYWPDDLNEQRKARQPYEEYGVPAGRLQPSPSPERRPADRPYADRPYPEERYGQRPPARPPAGPSTYPPQGGFDNGSMNRPTDDRPDVRSEGGPDRGPSDHSPNDRGQNDSGSNGYSDRPPENYSRPNASFANSNGPTERPNRDSRERPANGERTLDVKPYSEAPKVDLPDAPYS